MAFIALVGALVHFNKGLQRLMHTRYKVRFFNTWGFCWFLWGSYFTADIYSNWCNYRRDPFDSILFGTCRLVVLVLALLLWPNCHCKVPSNTFRFHSCRKPVWKMTFLFRVARIIQNGFTKPHMVINAHIRMRYLFFVISWYFQQSWRKRSTTDLGPCLWPYDHILHVIFDSSCCQKFGVGICFWHSVRTGHQSMCSGFSCIHQISTIASLALLSTHSSLHTWSCGWWSGWKRKRSCVIFSPSRT